MFSIVLRKFLLLLILITNDALARDGAGSGGGGGGLTEEGKLQLREFVEGVTCDWTDGPTFFGRPFESKFKMLNEISFVLKFIVEDPIFVAQIENEVVRTNVCMSHQPLRELPESVLESVTSYTSHASTPVQIGIRVDGNIFIYKEAFESMDEANQGYFLFHELMHGLIPMDTPARMTKLRDFVARFKNLRSEMPKNINDVTNGLMFQKPGIAEKVKAWKTKFMRMKYDSSVTPKPTITKAEAIELLGKYRDLGDTHSVQIILGWGLSPNAEGFSGRSLFNELVWEGRNCDVGDSTPLCKVLNGLISEYLFNGADPDSVFDNQEGWTPRPVWEYLLSSYAQRGKVRRLDLAEQIFFELLSKQPDGKLTEALKVRLNGLLLEFSKNPYLGAAVQKLVKFGANIDIVDAEGNSSLIIAATVGAGDTRPFRNLPPPAYMVAVLVKSGADISLKNLGGKTALEILEAKRSDLTSDANQVKLFEITCDLLKNGKSSLEKAENDLLALGYAPISN